MERPPGDLWWECELCGEKRRDRSWDLGFWDEGPESAYEWARQHRKTHEPVPAKMLFVHTWTDESGQEHRDIIQEGLGRNIIGTWVPRGGSERTQRRIAQQMMVKAGTSTNGHAGSPNGKLPERWGPVLDAKVVPLTIYLPAQLLEYYAEFQLRYPEAFPDREPETLGRWLLFCVQFVLMSRPDVFIHGRILLEADRLAAVRRLEDLRRLWRDGILTEEQYRAAVERLQAYPDLVSSLLESQGPMGGDGEDGHGDQPDGESD